MKVWYLKSRNGRSGRFFTTEKSYLSSTNKEDNRLLYVLDVSNINGVKSGDYYSNLLLERERDEQLSIILDEGDNFTKNFALFKRKFEEIAPSDSDPINFKTYYITKSKISRILKTVNEKKDFSNMVSMDIHKIYLLYAMPPTVEWFETILRCHNFQALPDTKRFTASEERKENFLKAKENLKQQSKKKK